MAAPFGEPAYQPVGFRTDNVFGSLAELWDDSKSFLFRPVQWVEDVAKEYPWGEQREICESVLNNRYTAVPSCHDSGKSFIAARIIAWWIDSHPPGEAFVVSTAPTAAQVSAILWRELQKVHTRAKLRGKITRAGYPQWHYGEDGLVGYGRKPADHEQSAFQGIHARYVLVVIDEACGVAHHLFDAVDALATNEHARVLAIGNPDDPGSHFANICKPDSGWNVIQIDGLRTPNFTRGIVIGSDDKNPRFPLTAALMRAEQIPFNEEKIPEGLREQLLHPLWVEERISRWAGMPREAAKQYENQQDFDDTVARRCATSPIFSAKVRGIFPTSSNTGVIPLGWVQLAVNRWHDYTEAIKKAERDLTVFPMARGRRVVGIDVARGGEDENALAIRQGNYVSSIERFRNADTIETANQAATFLHQPGSMAVVDVIGIGAGVYDTLRSWNAKGIITAECIAFNAAAQSHRTDTLGEFRFRNDRSAAWWNFREILDPSRGSLVALPDDERLIEELVAVGYDHLVGGVIKIEEKDEIRKRIGRSTDSADAVIQAFWVAGTATVGDKEFPYVEARRHDGVFRYEGAPTFSEDDFDVRPGSDGAFSGMDTPWRSMAPSYGSLPGDNNNWDV